MARGQERNPFVLVLIDGDGYVFDEDLVSSGAEGGQRAAHLLNQTIKYSLRNHGLENCRIMGRIYADLSGLSKTLSKVKLAGAEKRSLAPFVANFNRSNELFDFVDAGELKENADYKIRAMFRLFSENSQCKHIYFAGCHDVGYISELTPHVGNRDRITLVRSTTFHPEFSKLGMRTESFQNIFRLTPLDTTIQQTPVKAPTVRKAEPAATSINESVAICQFYPKGMCKYGKNCRFAHAPKRVINPIPSRPPPFGSPYIPEEWRQSVSGTASNTSLQKRNLTKNGNDFMRGNRTLSDGQRQSTANLADILPQADDILPGKIAVNNEQHRIDAYVTPSSSEGWAAFNARASWRKLCNSHQLTGHCINGTANCQHRGGKVQCEMPSSSHVQDLRIAELVPAIAHETKWMDKPESEAVSSGKGSSPSLAEKKSTTADGDDEKAEGAPPNIIDTTSMD